MLTTRLTRTALIGALGTLLLTSGCGGGPGPLTISGDSVVADPQPDGVWFNVRGCLRTGEDDPADVMITKIVPTRVEGEKNVELRVAWNPSREMTHAIAPVGEPPAIYRPFDIDEHSGGTLDACSLGIAVVLHPRAHDPVVVDGLDVTYQTDGATYTAHAEAEMALCPPGTKSGAGARGCH